MKRREFTRLVAFAAVLVASTALMPGGNAFAQDKKFKIGFSQATTIEPWRAQFNKDIIAEAAKHPEVDLIITDGEDKTEKQVADVENLIRQEVDALLISPKESAGLTGVVEKALDAKIPVIPNPVDACGEWRDGVGCSDASPSIGCSPEHGGAGPALSSGPATH